MREYISLKLLDTFKSTNVLQHYRHFKNLINCSAEEIKEIQNKKLKALLVHSKNTVPYYNDLLKNTDVNFEKNEIKDFLKNLPVLTRDHIYDCGNDLLSTAFSKNKLIKGSSSGTTGIPINYFSDHNGYSAGTASGYVLCYLSGWKAGKKSVHIWGNQESIKRWNTTASKVKNYLINQKNIASTLINDDQTISEVAQSVLKFDPEIIDGYSGSIYRLAEHFKQNNLSLTDIQRVFTTAENLDSYKKKLIEEVFAPTSDLYGSGEVLGIAVSPVNENKYYVFDPHVIVETIDSEIEGMKEILITDLDNYGMPFIRYKIGDLIDELHEPNIKNPYPFHWFTGLKGRCSDIIVLPNGKKIHPVNIFGGTLFRKYDKISRHKVTWDGKQFEFIFETNSDVSEELLKKDIENIISPFNVDYVIRFTKKLDPSKSGKYKYFEIKSE